MKTIGSLKPITTLVLVLLDQLIKYIITIKVNLYSSIKVIKNFFYITNVRNTGAAFSILTNHTIILIILSFILIGVIYLVFIKDKKLNKLECVTYSILFSGIIGNLIDRIVHGYVIDYLDFYIFGYDYPVFNLADICIVISIILIVIFILRGDKNANSNK
mgnify:CR=1 FL=1